MWRPYVTTYSFLQSDNELYSWDAIHSGVLVTPLHAVRPTPPQGLYQRHDYMTLTVYGLASHRFLQEIEHATLEGGRRAGATIIFAVSSISLQLAVDRL